MKIYVMKFSGNIEKSIFQSLLRLIDKHKQERIKRFIRLRNMYSSLLGDLLIRYVIMRNIGIANDKISFSTNEYGKPYLNNYNDFHFNISHSNDWIVCVVDDKPVGVDIEKIRPINFNIAKQFFSKEEHCDILAQHQSNRLSYFFSLWALKESYIKATGKGLSLPLNAFTLKLLNDNKIKFKPEKSTQINESFFKQFNIDPQYRMGVCGSYNKFPNSIIHKSFKNILNAFL